MKALRYLAPNVVKTEDIKRPVCAEGEALIRVHAAGICGTDLAIFAGKHPRAKAPLVMGHEFAGEIVEIKSSQNDSTIAVSRHGYGFSPPDLRSLLGMQKRGQSRLPQPEINNMTQGEGADIVFECAGSSPAALQMCELVRSRYGECPVASLC